MEAGSKEINPRGTSNGAWLPVFCPATNPARRHRAHLDFACRQKDGVAVRVGSLA
jgi:hypothetical protein